MSKSKIRVLLVFANPHSTVRLRLDTEERAIRESITLSRHRKNIRLTTRHASTIHDLRRALLKGKFRIVHISGHGTDSGLVFENVSGGQYIAPQEALASLFRAHSPPLKCVILNSCFSLAQGQLSSLGIPFTIAMEGSLNDGAAIEFSRGFYDAIGAGRGIEFAYQEGCRTVELAAPKARFVSKILKAAFGVYKNAVAEHFRTVRLLNQQLNIDRHYFPLSVDVSGASGAGATADVLKVLNSENSARVCLIGPSGAGKTTIVRRLLWENRNTDVVPFILSLRDYTEPCKKPIVPLRKWLRKSVRLYSGDAATSKALVKRIDSREGLFLFDGFDELRSDVHWASRIAEAIEAYFADSAKSKVLVTSRTTEDFLGRFGSFRQLKLNPVEMNDVGEFSSRIGPEFAKTGASLGGIAGRELFELRPVMLLIALLYTHQAGPRPGIGSLFQLLDKALSELLIDRKTARPRRGAVGRLSAEQVRDIRLEVLMRMVEGWPSSAKPCRIPESDLRDYVSASMSRIVRKPVTAGPRKMRYLVPTGICLEQLDLLGGPRFGFVHNSIQEFFYAKVLFNAIRRSDFTLLDREYYSAEILELLGEELDSKSVSKLLGWLTQSGTSLMVKKVSAGLLGFVKDKDVFPGLVTKLKRAFKAEEDVGVAGRIAEALRRLGKPEAIHEFVRRLAKYPPRERIDPSSKQSRPLTFEIDERLEGLEELTPALGKYLEHRNPVVRKHALILLMRVGARMRRHTLVRYCLREVENLEALGEGDHGEIEHSLVRSLRYGLAALSRYGSIIEEPFLLDLQVRLSTSSRFSLDQETSEQFIEVTRELQGRGWLPKAVVDQSGEEGDVSADVFLVRHAESVGNTLGKLLGSRLKGGVTKRGLSQAKAMAAALRDRVKGEILLVSSPAERARTTAKSIAKRFSCHVKTDRRLRELDFGRWSGRAKKEIASQHRELFKAWVEDPEHNHPPKGESLYEVRSRTFEALSDWIAKASTERKALVVVTHFFPLKAAYGVLAQPEFRGDPDNCAISKVTLAGGRVVGEFFNDGGHLKGIGFSKVTWR